MVVCKSLQVFNMKEMDSLSSCYPVDFFQCFSFGHSVLVTVVERNWVLYRSERDKEYESSG